MGKYWRLYRSSCDRLNWRSLGVKASEGTIYELSEIIQPHPALLAKVDAYFGSAIHVRITHLCPMKDRGIDNGKEQARWIYKNNE